MGILTGMNSFNPMSLGNVQLPQAPMGPRAASSMNHSVQMNSMGSVPGVSAPALPGSALSPPQPSLTSQPIVVTTMRGSDFMVLFLIETTQSEEPVSGRKDGVLSMEGGGL